MQIFKALIFGGIIKEITELYHLEINNDYNSEDIKIF